jgi:hypothetical protein
MLNKTRLALQRQQGPDCDHRWGLFWKEGPSTKISLLWGSGLVFGATKKEEEEEEAEEVGLGLCKPWLVQSPKKLRFVGRRPDLNLNSFVTCGGVACSAELAH